VRYKGEDDKNKKEPSTYSRVIYLKTYNLSKHNYTNNEVCYNKNLKYIRFKKLVCFIKNANTYKI
jgi:hypothetical protein